MVKESEVHNVEFKKDFGNRRYVLYVLVRISIQHYYFIMNTVNNMSFKFAQYGREYDDIKKEVHVSKNENVRNHHYSTYANNSTLLRLKYAGKQGMYSPSTLYCVHMWGIRYEVGGGGGGGLEGIPVNPPQGQVYR
jgi:hypothetical protein